MNWLNNNTVRFKMMRSGIKLIEETEGQGPSAEQGDTVEFESQAFLSRGDRAQDRFATATRLGSRRIIAGVEYSLVGMKVGGYRKVKISPHLAYRDEGVPDKVPPDAVLIFELWVTGITKGKRTTTRTVFQKAADGLLKTVR